jgi:hypothetical protein
MLFVCLFVSFFFGSVVLGEPMTPSLDISVSYSSTLVRFLGWRGGGGQPIARPLFTQDNTTQKDEDRHPCLEQYLNP